MTRSRRLLGPALVALTTLGACAPEADPTEGTYTLVFPSTAAAIATDTVQVFVVEVTNTGELDTLCPQLIQARKRKEEIKGAEVNPPVNTCALLAGKKPIEVTYGRKAALAVAQRLGQDFLIGCAAEVIGKGDAPVPIVLSLVDVGAPVPATTCKSVSDFCAVPSPCQAE